MSSLHLTKHRGATKQFEFYVSHNLDFEVSLAISKLWVPLQHHENSSNTAHEFTDDPVDFLSGEYQVVASIHSGGEALHNITVSTRTPPHPSNGGLCIVWEDRLQFPVKYKDLSADAALALRVTDVDGSTVGSTTMKFFSNVGRLRDGRHKLVLYMGKEPDTRVDTLTDGLRYSAVVRDVDHILAYDNVKNSNEIKGYLGGSAGALNRLTNSRVDVCLRDLSMRMHESGSKVCMSGPEVEIASHSFLQIDMHKFRCPVVYEEKHYQNAHSLYQVLETVGTQRKTPPVVYDWEMDGGEVFNPAEDKYRRMMHDQLRGLDDPSIKPNKQQKDRITEILRNPRDNMTNADKDLLWMFRYTLTSMPNAVVKFVLAVDWSVESEVACAVKLLPEWNKEHLIDMADALRLLSNEKEFKHFSVRSFAVERLSMASEDELEAYLPQLVAALRYEPSAAALPQLRQASTDTPPDGSAVVGGGEAKEMSAVDTSSNGKEGTSVVSLPPLGSFLVERGCTCREPYALANFLYWYLKVETLADNDNDVFKDVLKCLSDSLPSNVSETLTRQQTLVTQVAESQDRARYSDGNRDAKVAVLRKELAKMQINEAIPAPLNPNVLITGVKAQEAKMFKSALYPALIYFTNKLDEGEAEAIERNMQEVEKIKSKNKKMLEMLGEDIDEFVGKKKAEINETQEKISTYRVMIKNGDDVRQDQLVIQLIRVMDKCLKEIGLDLCLRPYRVLATGPTSGLLEFIAADDGSASTAVSAVLEQNKGSFLEFFKRHYPDEKNKPYGVQHETLLTFTKSSAGYAVITFLLGIGDRHLDNVMMLNDGHFLHIDFGYIFGDDPKKKFVAPPPFRFHKAMLDAMGGQNGVYYSQFYKYARQAYLQLRRHASLFLSLCRLMVDAGIEALLDNPQQKLDFFLERFRLDLDDEGASTYFDGVIRESVNHVGVEVLESFHRVAVRMR